MCKNSTEFFLIYWNELYVIQNSAAKCLFSISKSQSFLMTTITIRGKYVTQIVCEECKKISEREEEFSDLSLQVKGVKGVEESLCRFMSEERFEGDNKYYCNGCQKKVVAVRKVKVRQFPPILTLSLNRFEMDWVTMDRKKVNDCFSFPLELDVTSFKELPYSSPDNLYYLKCVIIHRGGAYGGHYHAYIRDELCEGEWSVSSPEKYAAEPKKEQKTVNLGLTKAMEENPTKRAAMKAEEKEQELTKKTQETELNYDECDFPLPYENKDLRKGWFDFDDESVNAIPFGRLQKQFGSLNENAYMLVYKQKKLTHKFSDPMHIPECWVESVITQNDVYQQQRDYYKQEEERIEVLFQSEDLFTFDDESMIKYKADKAIEEQGYKIKLEKSSTLAQLMEKLCGIINEKTGKITVPDSLSAFEVNRCPNEYVHVIRAVTAQPLETTLDDFKVSHLSTWIFCEKASPKNEILLKVVGENNFPIEIALRFLGEDIVFHTYKGISLGKLKETIYEKTTFPVGQQKLSMIETNGELKPIEETESTEKTLADLKFVSRTQIMLEVIMNSEDDDEK